MKTTVSMSQPLEKLLTLSVSIVILLTCLIGTIHADGTTKGKYLVYVGPYTDHDGKGIYAYRFDPENGQLSPLGLAAESNNPTFLTVNSDGRFLYASNELDTFNGQPSGALSAFTIDAATGKLTLLNQVSTHDPGPAHVALDHTGRFALASHYPKGSIAIFPISSDGRLGELSALVRHKGSGVNKQWQQGPHVHEVVMSPDDRFALVADPGIDQVVAYPFDAATGKLELQPRIAHVHPGTGPRHLVFDPQGKFVYVVGELLNSVTTYSYDAAAGELHEVATVSTLPPDFTGTSYTAEIAIHPSGKFLYASNRGYDTIAVFSIDPASGKPAVVEYAPSGGQRPRSFALDPTGSWLLVANQDSNNLVVFKVNGKTGRLTPTGQPVSVPSPACVTFVPAQ